MRARRAERPNRPPPPIVRVARTAISNGPSPGDHFHHRARRASAGADEATWLRVEPGRRSTAQAIKDAGMPTTARPSPRRAARSNANRANVGTGRAVRLAGADRGTS